MQRVRRDELPNVHRAQRRELVGSPCRGLEFDVDHAHHEVRFRFRFRFARSLALDSRTGDNIEHRARESPNLGFYFFGKWFHWLLSLVKGLWLR